MALRMCHFFFRARPLLGSAVLFVYQDSHEGLRLFLQPPKVGTTVVSSEKACSRATSTAELGGRVTRVLFGKLVT